ncbi:MAG: MerR family transcriptional regulator [Bacteroidia bacterium]|nr:MerR family transcriptional regulator [Bacteroidia bacterium]
MKQYGVKELSDLSGVTVRTLHHYDKIGLLKPLNRTEAGYRFYGEEEFLRLQQILFYKELDFSLKEISDLLDDPDFDLIQALKSHRSALEDRRKRISNLLHTIDHTLEHLNTGEIMSKPEKLYEGLPKELGTTQRQEAIDAYGKEAVEHAENELLKLGKADFKKLQAEMDQLHDSLFQLKEEDPKSPQVQQLIAKHYVVIRMFWGTSKKEDKQAEAYAGLGELYVSDPRYMSMNGKPQPEFSAFMKEAMAHFSKSL